MRPPQIPHVIALLILPLLAACTDPFSRGGGANQQAVDGAQSLKTVSYSEVAPIIKTYCVGCHADFATYDGAAAVAIYMLGELRSHEMPPAGKPQPSAAELISLESWLAAGALASGATPAPPTVSVNSATYSEASAVLKKYCVGCHAGLGSYAVVKASLEDIEKMVFQVHVMPPSNQPQPSPQELATLRAWISGGAEPDASVTPTPTPAPESAVPAKWSYISANIINQKCIKCHSAASKHGSLANYNDVFAGPTPKVVAGQPENSPLYQVLEDGAKVSMPPLLTGMSITPDERDAIHEWILNGAANDLLPQ